MRKVMTLKIAKYRPMTKNHFFPSFWAQERMRAENPVKRNSAGIASPQMMVTAHRTRPVW